jgi:hypothetical protein
MTRPSLRWQVPLVAVVVAVLGLLGATAGGAGHRLESAPAAALTAPGDHPGLVDAGWPPPGDAAIAQAGNEQRRAAAHPAPVLAVVGAALAGLAVAGVGAPAPGGMSLRAAPGVHVRRRGPPAPAFG